jgi:hypothetical protein
MFRGVPGVTSARAIARYVKSIKSSDTKTNTEPKMTKLLSLAAALALMAPVALATMNQAALIVA